MVTDSISPIEVDLSQVTSPPSEDTSPNIAPRPGAPDPETAVTQQVSQDLARRLNTDDSDIQTLSVEKVDWPNSALGCPTPDSNYLMTVTPGYKITLETAGKQYTYHTDMQGNAILCGRNGQPILPE